VKIALRDEDKGRVHWKTHNSVQHNKPLNTKNNRGPVTNYNNRKQ